MKELIKEIISENMLSLILLAIFVTYAVVETVNPNEKELKKLEKQKLQLEIQHLKYQVGIDSLRYDLEKTFYEKRKEQK